MNWYKKNESDQIWWLETEEKQIGEFIFSFDKKITFNLFADYPWLLTPEEKRIFDKENPKWAEFFKDRK